MDRDTPPIILVSLLAVEYQLSVIKVWSPLAILKASKVVATANGFPRIDS
jgi:hypothetical protein